MATPNIYWGAQIRLQAVVERVMMPSDIPSRRYRQEHGFVLLTMAIGAVALVSVLGLAVDVGKLFIIKNETQAYCDSAALAAALALDGSPAGITNARAAVADSLNRWNLNTAKVNNPTITFAADIAGPWSANPNPATGYTYARVAASVPVPLYFLPLVVHQTTQNVTSRATAGQIPITVFPRGLAAYTAVSTNAIGPSFGLVQGKSYAIQWPQFNGNRGGCGPGDPDKCFNSPPCPDDTTASKVAVVTSWGSSTSGYWGSTSNRSIEQAILDVIQLQPVAIDTNIAPILTSGNKASEAGYLDERASQDVNSTDGTVAGYFASSHHNGRRLIPVPIVSPIDSTHTTVIGYGQFLLFTNGSTSNYYTKTTNGNDPYCALYAGPYNVGSTGTGAGSSTGASRVKLVE